MSDIELEPGEAQRRLAAHLESFLGAWPPREPVTVVGSPRRDEPAWDGEIRPVAGVATPSGAVVSVPPAVLPDARALVSGADMAPLAANIGALVGLPGAHFDHGLFRYWQHHVDLEPLGEWVEVDDARIPDWLRPFNGGVLVAFDEHGRYAAGVGIKRHDALGHEIAVGTEPEHRGKGLARRLVATAAEAIIASGAIATYAHAVDNVASGAVAQAAGFPDEGWHSLGISLRE